MCCRAALEPGCDRNSIWLGPYDGPMGVAVRALKYGSATRLAPWLGGALAELASDAASNGPWATQGPKGPWSPQLVCAVPLHEGKRLRRGYNQAELVANALAACSGVPVFRGLERPRATIPQAGSGRVARIGNVAGAFRCRPLRARRVLLVDDVLTTGATAHACAVALHAAGAAEVKLAVIARAAPRDRLSSTPR